MPSQVGGALHDRDRTGAPTFVGREEPFRATQSKRRDEVETEGRGVIVVNEENDVGLLAHDPFAGVLKPTKHWSPVGFRGLTQIDGRAYRRHMTTADTSGDACHQLRSRSCLAAVSRFDVKPTGERPPATIIAT